jgi:hypothetical protein
LFKWASARQQLEKKDRRSMLRALLPDEAIHENTRGEPDFLFV